MSITVPRPASLHLLYNNKAYRRRTRARTPNNRGDAGYTVVRRRRQPIFYLKAKARSCIYTQTIIRRQRERYTYIYIHIYLCIYKSALASLFVLSRVYTRARGLACSSLIYCLRYFYSRDTRVSFLLKFYITAFEIFTFSLYK